MSFTPLVPPLPNIPGLPLIPGLPSLPLATAQIFSSPTLATASQDLGAISSLFGGSSSSGSLPQASNQAAWGIYTTANAPVLTADSVNATDLRKESHISDYPQEQGGFASYNKVQMPYMVRVRFSIGQTLAARTNFLNQLEAAYLSLTLYNVVTPEKVYTNGNIMRYENRREVRDGANMLIVDVYVEEVRPAGTQQNSSSATANSSTAAPAPVSLPASQVASPSSADSSIIGQVQAIAPTVQQLGQINLTGTVSSFLKSKL